MLQILIYRTWAFKEIKNQHNVRPTKDSVCLRTKRVTRMEECLL